MQGNGGTKSVTRQAILYFIFAAGVIALNLLIQKIHLEYMAPWICTSVSWDFVQIYYCSVKGSELVGSILGVGVSYIVKFILDKFIVFQKKRTDLKHTTIEFVKYFLFAILTTAINIGGQMLLAWVFSIDILIAGLISLAIGYIVKFLLDRKYVFPENVTQKEPATSVST